MLMTLLSALLIPFATGLLFVPIVRSVALQKRWVDMPDGTRKLHAQPTPNIGGIAIVASIWSGLAVIAAATDLFTSKPISSMIIVTVGGLMILGMGVYDDLYHLSFKKKFVVQIIVAYIILHAGYRVEVANLPFMSSDLYTQALYSIPLTLLWVVGLLNAINLLDGLDGLAAGVSLIAFVSFAAIFGSAGDIPMMVICLLMAGSLAAFLIHNFKPASIFMGDSGSLVLGYVLALCSLSLKDVAHGNAILALLVPVVVLGLPLYDTTLCIIRRMYHGRSPFAPDREHIHHRLSRLYPVQFAVLILYGIAAWFGVVAFLITRFSTLVSFSIFIITLIAVIFGERLIAHRDLLLARRGDGIPPDRDGLEEIPGIRVRDFDGNLASEYHD